MTKKQFFEYLDMLDLKQQNTYLRELTYEQQDYIEKLKQIDLARMEILSTLKKGTDDCALKIERDLSQ